MLSTSTLKQNDDPHDVLVVAPDVALVVPTDEELSKLAHTLRHPSAPRIRPGFERPAGATGPFVGATVPPVGATVAAAGATVPPVDATFRPAVGDIRVPGPRRAARVFTSALLLAGCAAAAAFAWQSYGDATERLIAQWPPQRILASLLPLERPAASAQPTPPAAATVAANAAVPPQPAAQAAPQGVAPSAADPSVDSAQSLRAMAHDLASAGQEIEQLRGSIQQLKGSIDQLTAGQQQMSRDIAKASDKASDKASEQNRAFEQSKASEQNLGPKMQAPPRRPAAARVRRPPPLARPQATLPPMPMQAAAPYVPRQAEPPPQYIAEPQADPDLASVPRPPMPLR
jgi:outer membrane murein-binding lipoprotein Lpp